MKAIEEKLLVRVYQQTDVASIFIAVIFDICSKRPRRRRPRVQTMDSRGQNPAGNRPSSMETVCPGGSMDWTACRLWRLGHVRVRGIETMVLFVETSLLTHTFCQPILNYCGGTATAAPARAPSRQGAPSASPGAADSCEILRFPNGARTTQSAVDASRPTTATATRPETAQRARERTEFGRRRRV